MGLHAQNLDIFERTLDPEDRAVVGGDIATKRDWGGKGRLVVPGVLDYLLGLRDTELNDVEDYTPGDREKRSNLLGCGVPWRKNPRWLPRRGYCLSGLPQSKGKRGAAECFGQ